jgi:hypothetical protein
MLPKRCERGRMAALSVQLVDLVIQPRQPGGQSLDGNLELGISVDECSQLVGEPAKGHLVLTPAARELLDSPIREVHDT